MIYWLKFKVLSGHIYTTVVVQSDTQSFFNQPTQIRGERFFNDLQKKKESILKDKLDFKFSSHPAALLGVFLCVPAVCVCFLTPVNCLLPSCRCSQSLCCHQLHSRLFLPLNSLTGRENEPSGDP